MKTICFISLFIFAIFSFGVMPAQAALVPAVDINQIVNWDLMDSFSLGWEFNVNTAISVTELGVFDLGSYLSNSDYTLYKSHEVGIYDSTGNLLVSGTVNPGDPLTNFFSYTSVTPTVLPIGTGYRIAAVTHDDYYTADPGVCTFQPEITFVQNRYTLSSKLAYPEDFNPTDNPGYFGPNFKSEVVVPGPATMLLLSSGLIALFALRRKFKE